MLQGSAEAAVGLLQAAGETQAALILAGAERPGPAWRGAAALSREPGLLGAVLRLLGGATVT